VLASIVASSSGSPSAGGPSAPGRGAPSTRPSGPRSHARSRGRAWPVRAPGRPVRGGERRRPSRLRDGLLGPPLLLQERRQQEPRLALEGGIPVRTVARRASSAASRASANRPRCAERRAEVRWTRAVHVRSPRAPARRAASARASASASSSPIQSSAAARRRQTSKRVASSSPGQRRGRGPQGRRPPHAGRGPEVSERGRSHAAASPGGCRAGRGTRRGAGRRARRRPTGAGGREDRGRDLGVVLLAERGRQALVEDLLDEVVVERKRRPAARTTPERRSIPARSWSTRTVGRPSTSATSAASNRGPRRADLEDRRSSARGRRGAFHQVWTVGGTRSSSIVLDSTHVPSVAAVTYPPSSRPRIVSATKNGIPRTGRRSAADPVREAIAVERVPDEEGHVAGAEAGERRAPERRDPPRGGRARRRGRRPAAVVRRRARGGRTRRGRGRGGARGARRPRSGGPPRPRAGASPRRGPA